MFYFEFSGFCNLFYFLLIFSFGVISKWAYKKSKWVYKFVVLFYFSTILITSGSLSLSLDPYRDKTKNSFSQWSLYKKQITKEKFCIPINPYPWIMCKNLSANIKIPVKDLFIPENNEYIFTPHNDMSLHGFIFEDNLNNFSVFYETSKNQIKKVTYLNPPDNLYTFAIMPSDSKTIRIDSEVFEKIKNTSMTYW